MKKWMKVFDWELISIVLEPGPMGWSETETGPGWRKNKKKKTRCDPASWPGKIRSKTRLQFVDFCFFLLKRHRFDFFKKNWPEQPSDPVKTWNPGLGPLFCLFKNIILFLLFYNYLIHLVVPQTRISDDFFLIFTNNLKFIFVNYFSLFFIKLS